MDKAPGKILVTGANGFVGSALCAALRAAGHAVVGAVREAPGREQVAIGHVGADTDWRAALAGCDVVIHLAARVHVMDDSTSDPLAAYRDVNRDGTLKLARQAQALGVRRMVFVSSIKVNGEATYGAPFSAADAPRPLDPYGQSKLEAEQGLRELEKHSGIEVVVVRPPLVYGPGVKANFANLLRLVKLGVPLPFASVHNQRSMVALGNLVDLLIVCARHPRAPGQTFLVSDGEDLSIGQLVGMIARGMGKPARLLPFPPALMGGMARLLGKTALVDRLIGSLQVDMAPTRAVLDWTPPHSPQDAIGATAAHFVAK